MDNSLAPLGDISSTPKRSEKFVPWEPFKGAAGRPTDKNENSEATRAAEKDFVIKEKIPYRIEGVWRKSSIQLPKTQVDIDHSVQSESGIRIETPLDKVPNDPFLGQTHIESSTEVPVVPEDTVETLKRQIVELSQNCQHFYQQHQRSEADKQSLLEQLEFQVKVNSELKSLLIATMGDDLQTKLESLSVDKVRLGQNIVEFTKKLNDDFEVLDKMNIQCDMWRSKFLASSVMIDELTNWRLFLTRNFEAAQHSVALLLAEVKKLPKYSSYISPQVLNECEKLTQIDTTQFYPNTIDSNRDVGLPTSLMNRKLEELLRKNLTFNCCGKCNGEIKLV